MQQADDGSRMGERADEAAALAVFVNGAPRALPRGATVADLVRALGLRPELVAVEVNRVLVPRRRHAEHALDGGDRVELVTLVGGG
jgi:thiamine biosynthesis protein ThiS